jgi:hypothetical protein
VRLQAHNIAASYALNLLADRREGHPYDISAMPVNPLTGLPFETKTRDGLLVIGRCHIVVDGVNNLSYTI